MKDLFHLHLLVKCHVQNPPKDVEFLKKWFTELVSDINMKICIAPQARYVDVPGNRGLTGLVGIETSHSSIHVWDETDPGMIQMDVYSCSCFEPETVLNKLREFGLLDYEMMVIDRNDGFVVKAHEKG
jgi:S-adenosylmethionine/arginine decarboxylase-like enzyme